jgi:hypothetical protein
MSAIASGGSAVSACSVAPSLHLSKLIDLLARSLKDLEVSSGSRPFLHCSDGRVIINPREVLWRMFEYDDFKSAFAPGTSTGFVRDIVMPPLGADARVGGRLLAGSQLELKKAIDRMIDAIEAHIDQSVPADVLSSLSDRSVKETIDAIAANSGVRASKRPDFAQVVPVAFADSARKVGEKKADVARMFSAIERSDGGGDLDRFLSGIANFLQKREFDEDDIATITQSLRSRAEQPNDRINRFLQFMDDEALARVRSQIAMRLMLSIANQSKKYGFRIYAARVFDCFEQFAGPRGSALLLDVSAGFGEKSQANLSDFLRRAGFYSCLPVWPEWSVQMFEARPNPAAKHGTTVRDVSYRFRVNGENPELKNSAFDVRIEGHEKKIEAIVQSEIVRGEQSVARQVAELVFLWLVVPDSIDHPNDLDVGAQAADIAQRLKSDPVGTLRAIISDLRARRMVVEQIADELVTLIKTQSHNVLTTAAATTGRFRVSVSRSIIDWTALDSYTDKSEILRHSNEKHDNIEWLEHLTVGEDVILPNSLFSFVVETHLQERSLTANGAPRRIKVQPDLSDRALPVRLAPYELTKQQHEWRPVGGTENALDPGFGIEVQYKYTKNSLGKSLDLDGPKLVAHEQRRAANISAFTALVYVTLWLLSRRVRANCPDFTTLILRVAREGKLMKAEDDAASASSMLYAISQALEKALAREGNVKLQGYTADNTYTANYRKRGAIDALAGGQALSFNLEGSVDRVALVTYVTRPCDTHPASLEPEQFLFICRTYVAERNGSSAQIKVAGMRTRVIGSRDQISDAQPILTELAWLESQGYEHVMLLSHHFGNRHLGRAAERHAPHGSLEFLDKAHQQFPKMRFYPLRRDVFPAMRLHRRSSGESAFEVLTFADHQRLYEQYHRELLRGVMPIYTFATLHVIARKENENGRPQSGFCTYFVDVERRMNDLAWQESTKADILGFGGDGGVRASLISVLRAVHFLESEKQGSYLFLPVLDPYSWVAPIQRAHAGEVEIMKRRRSGAVVLSLPAVLSHITEVLKSRTPEKDAQA